MLIKKIAKKLLLIDWNRAKNLDKEYFNLTTREIFSKIYKEKIWGHDDTGFFSGGGSSSPNIMRYVDFLDSFINENRILKLVDIGCGDFRVMKQLTEKNDNLYYTGVDIVPDLISHNNSKFSNDHISFLCLDAIREDLPNGDLVTVRQVLQHLNNQEVSLILAKLKKYRYSLISEHILTDRRVVPNKDKRTGNHTRLDLNSSLFLDLPPFSLPAKNIFEYEEPYGSKNAVIRTFLVTNSDQG